MCIIKHLNIHSESVSVFFHGFGLLISARHQYRKGHSILFLVQISIVLLSLLISLLLSLSIWISQRQWIEWNEEEKKKNTYTHTVVVPKANTNIRIGHTHYTWYNEKKEERTTITMMMTTAMTKNQRKKNRERHTECDHSLKAAFKGLEIVIKGFTIHRSLPSLPPSPLATT